MVNAVEQEHEILAEAALRREVKHEAMEAVFGEGPEKKGKRADRQEPGRRQVVDGDAAPQQEARNRPPEQQRDDGMHVRQRFQKVVLEKPDGRLRPIGLNGVRHGASPGAGCQF